MIITVEVLRDHFSQLPIKFQKVYVTLSPENKERFNRLCLEDKKDVCNQFLQDIDKPTTIEWCMECEAPAKPSCEHH